MDKRTKGIIGFLVALIIAVVVFLCYTYAKDNGKNKNIGNTQVKNEMSTNVVENTIPAETNNVAQNVVEPEPEKKEEPEPVEEPEENSELQDDNDEEKAISIVKKDIGDTDGLSFKVENNGDGSYDVCVSDENSRALAWYTVWPKSGKFTK